ncbi:MAG: hypothetical protein LBH70_07605, partial [Spirochaetaceae bacterium]|nr:hypothetical protein [Spirochaetaceae bacterium]
MEIQERGVYRVKTLLETGKRGGAFFGGFRKPGKHLFAVRPFLKERQTLLFLKRHIVVNLITDG